MQSATAPALDHLLRTLAPVPTTCRILSLGASETAYAASAALLGFDVAACDLSEDAVPRLAPHLQPASDHFTHLNDPAQLPYPDAAFDWIVASTLLAEAAVQDLLPELLKETRRVLKPGGWIYIIARAAPPDAPARNGHPHPHPYRFTHALLTEALEAAFDPAQVPRLVEHDGDAYWQAIYRRVDPGTVA